MTNVGSGHTWHRIVVGTHGGELVTVNMHSVVVAHRDNSNKTIKVFSKQADSLSLPGLWADIFPCQERSTASSTAPRLWCIWGRHWSYPSIYLSCHRLWEGVPCRYESVSTQKNCTPAWQEATTTLLALSAAKWVFGSNKRL